MTQEEKLTRKKKLRAIIKKIAAMTENERNKLAIQMNVRTVEGRSLSLHNSIMLSLQSPTATIIGGFNQWKKAGRVVKKGEHGSAIWVPYGVKKQIDQEDDYIDEPTGFGLGTVFDISQTEAI